MKTNQALGLLPVTRPALEILHEDNHLLAVSKPPGLPTMGVAADRPSLLAIAKEYLKERYHKPGNVYLGIVSRLDAPVSGAVLLARTSKAARRLTEQFRGRSVQKVYWALVEGEMEPASGECVDWLGQDERHRRMWVVGPQVPGAQRARLTYRQVRRLGAVTQVEVLLDTGRKHQIRLQLAHRGHPIVGDRKYGGSRAWPVGIALHARRLVVAHPTGGGPLVLEAPLPAAWGQYGLE